MVKSINGLRRRHIVFVVVTCFAVAGGIAYASIPSATGIISGCYRVSTDDQKGQIRAVAEPGNCRSNELPIEWSVTGPQGPPGQPGADGEDGKDGKDGDPFSGTFTSPNGQYSLSITDAGIRLSGAGSFIELDAGGIEVSSATALTLRSGLNTSVRAGLGLSMEAGGSAAVDAGGVLTLDGALVRIHPGTSCAPGARLGDPIAGTAAPDGTVTGVVAGGTPSVCLG